MPSWSDPFSSLFRGGKLPANAAKVHAAGVNTLWDLLWIFPLRVQKTPVIQNFSHAVPGQLFKGVGRVISHQITPAFRGRGKMAMGKGRAPLSRGKLIVESLDQKERMILTWFNIYPSMKKKLEALTDIEFMGTVTDFQGKPQIVNPQVSEPKPDDEPLDPEKLMREYPTINGVAGRFLQSYIDKIPVALWNEIPEKLPVPLIEKRKLTSIKKSFAILHGLIYKEDWNKDLFETAKKRLVYEEFFQEQMKVISRRQFQQKKVAVKIASPNVDFEKLKSLFPYELTDGQSQALAAIREDFSAGVPMMRMIQGDVGCGKTTVAFIACVIAAMAGHQAALMCPTEALAQQHFENAKELFGGLVKIESLTGSHKEKEKKAIVERLKAGEIDFVIGTHSLFQKKVEFKDLKFIVIDEQHKFGVEQRLTLVRKGVNPHTLIMTATPIPRSLSLTQYGDLDISIINTIPMGRKGTQTRIVHPHIRDKYLSFVKTRLDLNEQVFIVAPAIEESEMLDIENVTSIKEKYDQYFPNNSIALLHGRLKSEEKDEVFKLFIDKKVDILISTSVIEVGINNPNATVISIYNPERFGLSSLHQLRGRVGRGEKPGFCFLVCDENMSKDSLHRVEVIEQTTDGFLIAEKDLEIRGQGDLFGVSQSGSYSGKRLANIVVHAPILATVIEDVDFLKTNHHQTYLDCVLKYNDDEKVHKTI